MSIKRKLTIMLLSISLAAVMLTVLSITTYLIYDMRKSKAAELGVTAALTGDRNGAALIFLDSAQVSSNLEIFRLNPSILAACIYDRKGGIFAAYRGEGAANGCPDMLASTKEIHPDLLTSTQNISKDGEVVGHVFLVSDTRDINTYVSKITQISATVSLLVFMVTLLLTVYFQRTISGPILELAATAKAITEKRDYTLEAKAIYPDETSVLAKAFNAMVSEVRKRDAELMQVNETLEQKVQQRTQQLEDAKRKAESASDAKSEFLRNMSHEFRTPLHAILSFSSYGINEHETAERDQMGQYFELIQKGAERLSRLVNEVLDLAKLERREHKFLLTRGDLRDLVSRSAGMVKPLFEEKNITLHFEHSQPPAVAVCDHDKIVQVITNLLSNAIKFTPANGAITLRTDISGDGDEVIISVIDQGIGIPEDEKDIIFESFRQSSRTNTGAGGTGLGLAICRSIVEAHNGRIWAENNFEAAGACVTFVMPAALEEGDRVVTVQATETKNDHEHEHAA